jgi:hypothetical protein
MVILLSGKSVMFMVHQLQCQDRGYSLPACRFTEALSRTSPDLSPSHQAIYRQYNLTRPLAIPYSLKHPRWDPTRPVPFWHIRIHRRSHRNDRPSAILAASSYSHALFAAAMIPDGWGDPKRACRYVQACSNVSASASLSRPVMQIALSG